MAYREGITVGSYVHVCNRGTKKMQIFREQNDLWRLVFNLYYLNHNGRMPDNWTRDVEKLGGLEKFVWPVSWRQQRSPLVGILGFCIMPNHFHLILKEITEGGVRRFMHRITMAYSKYVNDKYDESGRLFQGPYRSRTVLDTNDLCNLAAYVMVKNPLELYSGGSPAAYDNFNEAYTWAVQYPFSSLGDYAGQRTSPILDNEILGELFSTPDAFQKHAEEMWRYRTDKFEDFVL
jgi:putative transposase